MYTVIKLRPWSGCRIVPSMPGMVPAATPRMNPSTMPKIAAAALGTARAATPGLGPRCHTPGGPCAPVDVTLYHLSPLATTLCACVCF